MRTKPDISPAVLSALFGFAVACSSSASGTAGGRDASPTSDGGDSATGSRDSSLPDGGSLGDAEGGLGEGGNGQGLAWKCPAGPFGAPIPAGAVLTRVAAVPPSDSFNDDRSDDTTVEGPVWIGQALYDSEFLGTPNPPPSRILQTSISGSVVVVDVSSGSNGLAVDSSGVLYGAIHEDGSVSRFDLATGERTPVATSYQGARFNSPNDLTIRNDGNIYFSDPTYQAPTPPPQGATRVYRIAPGTNAVTVVDDALTQPNGVTLSLDQNTLYVSSTGGLYSYPVMADGSTGPGAVFAAGLSLDGMAIDCAGNLYAAEIGSGDVVVLSSAGAQIGQLTAAGVGAVTNTAFGGPDRKTLYVSAQGAGGQQGLFEVALAIPGMPY